MNWLLLTILAIASRADYGVAGKVMSNKLDVGAQTLAVTMLGLSSALAVAVSPLVGHLSFAGFSSHWEAVGIVILASAAGNVLYFEGLTRLDASVVQIAFSSIIGWGAVLSTVVLGSHFSLGQVFGIFLLVAAIWLSLYEHRQKAGKAVACVLGAALLFAIFQVASAKISHAISPGTYLLLTYLGPAILIGLVYSSRISRDLRATRGQFLRTMRVSALTALTTVSYYLCAYFAYRKAPDAGVVIVLLASQVVFAVLLSALLLKEHQHLVRKLVSAVVAVAASALISG